MASCDPRLLDLLPSDFPLLDGIPEDRRPSVLGCLGARIVRFEAGEVVLRPAEDEHDSQLVRMIASGCARAVCYDANGNRSLIESLGAGDVLSSATALVLDSLPSAEVVAVTPGSLVEFAFQPAVDACPCCLKHVNRVRANLLSAIEASNRRLTGKLELLSLRTSREKIMAYLSRQAADCESNAFAIPYNRQELADYLCIDRSALSRELGKLQRDGIIDFDRNSFSLRCALG